LRNNNVPFTGKEEMQGFTSVAFGGRRFMMLPAAEGWFAFDSIDLTDVASVMANVGWQTAPTKGIDLEIRLDAPDGKLLGKGSMPVPKKDAKGGAVLMPIEAITDGKLHKLYFVYKTKPGEAIQAAVAGVQFNGK
jgi:hypothetical protein